MNSIPYNLIIPPSCDTSSNSKNKFSIKSLLQEIANLPSLCIIWKVSGSMGRRETDIASFTSVHAIADSYGSHIFMPLAMHLLIDWNSHVAWRLISDHVSIYSRTDRTFQPFLVSKKHFQTIIMHHVTALQTNYVFIRGIYQLFLQIFGPFELKLTNTAFILLWLGAV